MQQVVNGVIDRIFTVDVPIKNGPRAGTIGQVYHADVGGIDVNLGFKCDFVEGQSVNWTVEEKYGSYQIAKGNGAVPGGVATAAQTSKEQTIVKAAPAFPTRKNTKDVSIIRQNSLRHANVIVKDMIAAGVIPSPVGQDNYVETVIEVAYVLTDFSTGWREEKQAEAIAAYEGDK